MIIPVGRKYLVELLAPRGLGAGQIVRVYRKGLLFRHRLSSDWFLDQLQAERFARRTAADLAAEESGSGPYPPLPR